LTGDGALPPALSDPAGDLNLTHRDIRLALGQTRDGRLLLAMTRYDAMGKASSAVPLGPTTPEMAAIMGALGARDAVMLDGGISAQLLLREAPGQEPLEWRGWRNVPLGLIARARAPQGMK
jgi:exopolysaccharide biosynthesis protein